MHGGALLTENDGGRLTITIDRPERRNAVDLETVRAIGGVIAEARSDPSVTVVVLRGAGHTFCAGADVGDLQRLLALDDETIRAEFDGQLEILAALSDAPLLTVAVAEGAVLGFGVALAASCDLVFADQRATFGLPEIRLGMAPAMVLPSLVRRVAVGSALDLAASGRTIDAHEAARIGLVDRILDGDVDTAVDEAVEAWQEHDPQTVRHTVQLVRGLASASDVDIAAESCRALRSPRVAELLRARRSS